MLDREAVLFKQIARDLEQETRSHRSQIMLLERQLQCINELRSETETMQAGNGGEPDVETLRRAGERGQIIRHATQSVEKRFQKA